jgi:hypothetical protein
MNYSYSEKILRFRDKKEHSFYKVTIKKHSEYQTKNNLTSIKDQSKIKVYHGRQKSLGASHYFTLD